MTCRSPDFTGRAFTNLPWFNWAGLAGGFVQAFREPATLPELVTVVEDAHAANGSVRVVGSGWAFEDNAYSSETMVSLKQLNRVLESITDPQSGALLDDAAPAGRTLIQVEAGITIAQLNDQLAARGLAMPTLGGANGQTLVGALSTSTHGGDFDEPPFCDLVRAVHLVGVGGQEYWIESKSNPITSNARLAARLPCPETLILRDDDVFKAVTVGLGCFGVIYSVVVETVPAYSLARQRVLVPFIEVAAALDAGVRNGTFLDPLFQLLPPPAAELNAVGGPQPRAMELIIDSRNPQQVHVLRRWNATGPDLNAAFGSNALCDIGAPGVLMAAAAALVPLGMTPGVVNPFLLLDPTRPFRLSVAQTALVAQVADVHTTAGEALALVSNAYWDFGIGSVLDLLAKFTFMGQFSNQRSASYRVMTGDPAFNSSNCYRANSCEIIFDATDGRYLAFLRTIQGSATAFDQAGYISCRYSKRSNSLLSMHNVFSEHAVSVEVSTLKGLRGSAGWIAMVLALAKGLGGRAHWGQQHHLSAAEVTAQYGADFDVWRSCLGAMVGHSKDFSSAFTLARGLEPVAGRQVQFEGSAQNLAPNIAPILALLL